MKTGVFSLIEKDKLPMTQENDHWEKLIDQETRKDTSIRLQERLLVSYKRWEI
jgi:hypothetical protein